MTTEQAVETPKQQKSHRLRKSLVTFVFFVAALELGLRLFGYGSYTVYRTDQRLLWVPEPGRTLTIVNHLPLTISEDGFRYKQTLGAKQPGQIRIFAFGDSTTMGWGVGDDSTYSADLERMLNSSCTGSSFQVVSAGVNAYPNSIVVERAKKVIEDGFQPDVAIIAYSFNTNFESFADLQGAERQRFLRRVQVKALIRRSAIYNFLVEGVFRELVYYRLRHVLIAGSLDTTKAAEDLNIQRFKSRLSDTLKLCKSKKTQMVLLVLASEGQKMELHPFQTAMLEFANENDVPVVNMVDSWKAKDHGSLFMDHAHPTAEGHQLIAQELFRTLQGVGSVCRQASEGAHGR